MDTLYLYPNSEISGDLAGSWYSVNQPYNEPDEDASFVQNNVCGASVYEDIYGIQDQVDIGTISKVTILYRWRTFTLEEGLGEAGCFCYIQTHENTYMVQDTVIPSATYKNESKEWITNPFTGVAWTWEEINDLKIKIASKWSTCFPESKGRCTQVYVKVEGDWYDPPTVTTQAVTNILSITATGNGNITATGDLNATKRGVCWNTTGSPTVADYKSEEIGTFGTGAFTRPMTGLSPGIHYYVKAYAYNPVGYSYGGEVEFTTDKVAPTVTTQDPTDILITSATGNGNITALGGENSTVRGFKYGLTKNNTWDAHDDGDFGAGAFTKGIVGLVANTEYWIRAYATNTIGTNYGEWIQFQTAAAGTTPTGTMISICSDYSGYTYILNESLTDDGNAYESYFVISTDLADKQGLHFKKRLEDLYSYFEKKDSGTCKIYVKRDNETTWQYCGQILMTGDEDIIVKHLPSENQDTSGDIDFAAKHFLIRFVFQNDFAFIGLVTEAILIGVR